MATATGQRFSNGSLNGVTHDHQHLHGHANGNGKYHHHMRGLVGGDDDTTAGGATEQFPAFDPSHDGSEEDTLDEYTHSAPLPPPPPTTTVDDRHDAEEAVIVEENSSGNGAAEDVEDEDDQSHTTMSNVDPVPELELCHHQHQQQQDAHRQQQQQHRDGVTSATTQTTTATTTLSPVTSPPYWALSHFDTLSPGGPSSSSHPFNNHSHNNQSTDSLVPGAITLQDNEAEDHDDGRGGAGPARNGNGEAQRNSEETRTSYGRDRNKACWARSVEVTNYVIVNGSATNIGAFVVWNIRVQTLSVSTSFSLPSSSLLFSACPKRLPCRAGLVFLFYFADLDSQGPYMNIRKRYSEFDDFRHRLIQTFPNFEAAVPVLPPKSVIAKFRPRFLEKRRAGLQYFLKYVQPRVMYYHQHQNWLACDLSLTHWCHY